MTPRAGSITGWETLEADGVTGYPIFPTLAGGGGTT